MADLKCPGCGAARAADAAECGGCGIIFAKWKQKQERAQAAPAPRPVPEPASGGSNGLLVNLLVCVGLALGGYYFYTHYWAQVAQSASGLAGLVPKDVSGLPSGNAAIADIQRAQKAAESMPHVKLPTQVSPQLMQEINRVQALQSSQPPAQSAPLPDTGQR